MVANNILGQGRPPLGYRRGEDGRLQEVAKEAELVRLIFDLYDRDRVGYRGVQIKKGSTFWFSAAIEKILKDPVYTG